MEHYTAARLGRSSLPQPIEYNQPCDTERYTAIPLGGWTVPILDATEDDDTLLPAPSPATASPDLPSSLTLRLYLSHFLSTWNSRLFEFGAVLFLADIFPSSLLPLSIYALVRSAAVILGAQAVGEIVDREASSGRGMTRAEVVRRSIVGGRLAVAVSCLVLVVLEMLKTAREVAAGGGQGKLNGTSAVVVMFCVLVVLACAEKLCATMNLVAVERDWVVAMTGENDVARQCKSTQPRYGKSHNVAALLWNDGSWTLSNGLAALNARMRRIDLLCKLLGPLAIGSIAAASTAIAIWTTLAMNLISILPEYICISQVYQGVPALHQSPERHGDEDETPAEPPSPATTQPFAPSWFRKAAHNILPLRSLPYYFYHPAFLPSFSLSLLYLTVLSLSGQMITYLLSIGFTPLHVAVIRLVSTAFELGATWAAPWLMRRIGVVRSAIWSLSWQMIWLAAGAGWYFSGMHGNGNNDMDSVAAATGLVVGVAFSRVGLWSYDLCAQDIIQDEVGGDHRGSFSTVEAAFQNLFELASYATTVVFSRPDQFKWPVVISIAAVYVAGGLYACFVRQRRGHLFHRPACMCLEKGGDMMSGRSLET